MKRLIVLTLVGALAACAEHSPASNIVSIGQGTYMVTEASGSYATEVKAKAYKDANAFCATGNSIVQTVNVTAEDGVPFARHASAELDFKCVVGKADPAN